MKKKTHCPSFRRAIEQANAKNAKRKKFADAAWAELTEAQKQVRCEQAERLRDGYAEQFDNVGKMLVRAGVITEKQIGSQGIEFAVRDRFEPPDTFFKNGSPAEVQDLQERQNLRRSLISMERYHHSWVNATIDQIMKR